MNPIRAAKSSRNRGGLETRSPFRKPGARVTPSPFLPPPQRCEPLASIVARFGGTCELHAPGTRVTYPLPTHGSDEVRDFWQNEVSAEAFPEFTARVPNGRVFGAGIVLAPDGASLARDVSLDFGKSPETHWLLTYGKIPPPQTISGTTAVIASTLASGYGHWLLDELPRLLALPRDPAETLIGHSRTAFSRTALARWGWSGPVLYPERDSHVQCEQLVVPSLVGTVVQPTRRTLDLVREFTAGMSASLSHLGERIYISRSTSRRRRVTNEPELVAMLTEARFSVVHLEQLTWAEQISSFRQAKVIVSPHGAGLANLAFCAPGTRVIELFNRAYVHGCYGRVAALQALDYWPLVPHAPEPLGQATANNRLNVVADLAQVHAAVKAL